MAKYKMLKTQSGVKAGEVHPSVFHEGKVYEIHDDLAEQFKTLDAVEETDGDEVETAVNEEGRDDLHENWLDTDPAVMRHGELTPEEIVARDESPATDGVAAEGDEGDDAETEESDGPEGDGEPEGDDSGGDGDDKPEGEKKAKKARKSAPENK